MCQYSDNASSGLQSISRGELENRLREAECASEDGRLVRADLRNLDLAGERLFDLKLMYADLRGSTLRCADLHGADLHHAILRDADLRGTNLGGASLRGADLQRANLSGADLSETDLNEADLRNCCLFGAKLEKAARLQSRWLAGADLSCAQVPEDLGKFEGLKQVNEISQIARPIFLTVITVCFYSLLTVATTKDANLLTNTAASKLPVIQTEFPIAWFYWVAPLIMLLVFVYFHLYLQRLWAALAELPARFPDGQSLDQKAYPWLLNGLVRANFERLRSDRAWVSYVENAVSIFLVWWLVPLTISLFWSRYLSRQDWIGTAIQISCASIAIALGAASFYCMIAYLKRFQEATSKNIVFIRKWGIISILIALAYASVLYIASLGTIAGTPFASGVASENTIRTWVPALFSSFGYVPYAYLQERDVSTKPPSWTGTENIQVVLGADLQGRRLRYANAVRAFLVNADLRNTDLRGANLEDADLRGAKLEGADLAGVNLLRVNLTGADLRNVKGLTQAQLEGACGDGTQLPPNLTIKSCPKPN